MTIRGLMPKTFILENVAGLKNKHRKTFDLIVNYLQGIRNAQGTRLYRVRAKMLDTVTHGGLPQARPRVYIVGWRRMDEQAPFRWPVEIAAVALESLLEGACGKSDDVPRSKTFAAAIKRAADRMHAAGDEGCRATYVINVGASASRGGGAYKKGASPCLTRTRCMGGGHWISNRKRQMLTVEMERLQGVPPGRLQVPDAVRERAYWGMLGNACTVSVVGRVVLSLFRAVGLVDSSFQDPWTATT